jgi:hypothetical protein
MTEDEESFLKRWSRLKRQPAADPAESQPESPPPLPALDTLGPDSDFSAFMHPKVDPLLRRAALATLFRSPQFQAMDGLDVYVGDYSNPAPLAPAVAAGLRHARSLFARGDAEEKTGPEPGSEPMVASEPPRPDASPGSARIAALPGAPTPGTAGAGAATRPAASDPDHEEQS